MELSQKTVSLQLYNLVKDFKDYCYKSIRTYLDLKVELLMNQIHICK